MSKVKASGSLDESAEDRIINMAWRWFPVAIVIGTVAAGKLLGAGFGVLVLAAGAFIAAIAAIWGSVRSLFGEVPLAGEDAFALGSPSAEEEQKRAIIRAIKDLEFEHNVGKISDRDYDELIVKYRAEAKRLLRVLDNRAAPARAEAEKLADAHLAKRGIDRKAEAAAIPVTQPEPVAAESDTSDEKSVSEPAPPPSDDEDEDGLEDEKDGDEDEEDGDEEDGDEDAREDARDADELDVDDHDGRVVCSECGASNEPDAAFCKKCASELGTGDEDEDE